MSREYERRHSGRPLFGPKAHAYLQAYDEAIPDVRAAIEKAAGRLERKWGRSVSAMVAFALRDKLLRGERERMEHKGVAKGTRS